MTRALPAILALAFLAAAAPVQAQTGNPLQQAPGISPPGANDPACRPSAARPVPVILVHGTFADMTISWNLFSPVLRRAGWCVYALDLVRRGTAPMDESADKLAAFIDQVRAQTGAAKVSLVGHSQGGMLPRYVARYRGKLGVIDDIVGLAPSSHGTTTPLAGPAGVLFDCPACIEQEAGSPFMQRLNAGVEAPPPISYTVVSTRYDEVVTPYTSQALAGSQATNVVLQRRCPNDLTEHVGIIYDPIALEWAVNALQRRGLPANPAFEPDCSGATFGHDPQDGLEPPSGSPSATTGATAPRVTLLRRRVRARHGVAAFRARCRAPAGSRCAGRLQLNRPGGRRAGARTFGIAAGRTATVRVRLARAPRAILRRHGRVEVRARALVPQPGGGVAVTSSRRYVVRAARR